MAAYDMEKGDIARRLARIEGQVRGVARMVDEDRYCIDIFDQVSAITKALQQVSLGLLHGHLEHCPTGYSLTHKHTPTPPSLVDVN